MIDVGCTQSCCSEGRAHVEKAAPDHVDQVRHFFIDLLSRRQLTDLAKALEPVVAGPGD